MTLQKSDAARIIASNIKYQLALHEMTRSALASHLGVSVATVGYWCTAQKIPRMDKIDSMCKIFNITRSQLLSESSSVSAIPSSAASPFSPDELALIRDYNKLNELGKEEARKRIAELTEIQKYIEDDYKKDEAKSV